MIAAAPASAATTTFRPVADTYVSSTSPTANYGTASTLKVDGSPIKNGYLRFDVQGLTQPVKRVTLRLRSHNTSGKGIRLHPVADTLWFEPLMTYATAPPLGAPVSDSGGFTAGQWATVDATTVVRGNGVVTLGISTLSDTSKSFSSREVTAEAPELVVETESPPPPPPPPPPPTAEDPVVAAAGDIACDPADASFNAGLGTTSRCRQLAVSDLLTGGDLAAVLPLGDIQYEDASLLKFMTSYEPSWGRVKSLSRPVAGNHEYYVPGAAGYFDYFNGIGNATGLAGARDRGYYSFDIGSWHLVALNSNCSQVGGCGPGSPQEQWLRQDLAANPASCTLAYWHHPRFTSGTYGAATATGPLWSALYEAGADVVLTGHEHSYERFARQDPTGAADPARGIRQFVVGTGGKSHYGFAAVAPNSGARDQTSFGVLRLRLGPTGYEWRFAPEAGATFTDAGTDVCDGPTVDAQAPAPPTALSATAPSPGTVNLAWTASTDNDGVSGYRVLRDGATIATTSNTTYVDATAAPATTYSYTVRALDPSGNVSGPSTAATVTTPLANTITFTPTDDAYVLSDYPTTNYGASTSLQVDNGPVRNFLVKFAVAGVGTRPVLKAELKLYAVDPSSRGGVFQRVASNDWSQSTVTWANAPLGDGTTIGSIGAVAVGNWYTLDVSSVVKGDGVLTLRATSPSSDSARYSSKEGTAGFAPRLVVTTG